MEKFYKWPKDFNPRKEITIVITKRCWARTKTELFNTKKMVNFDVEPQNSLELIKGVSRRCFECCGDHKCAAYWNFMQDCADKYRECKEKHK